MTSTDVTDRLLRRSWRQRREIVTPEGVPLTVELAEFSERAIALLIDILIWFGASVAMVFALGYFTAQGLSWIAISYSQIASSYLCWSSNRLPRALCASGNNGSK